MAIDETLFNILACPKCKGKLQVEEDQSGLICKACELKYPIEDDIPIMLINEAISLSSESKWESIT